MARGLHLLFKEASGPALPTYGAHAERGGQSAMLDRQPEPEPRALQSPQFHILTPIADGRDTRLECTCGWISGCYLTEAAARRILGNECPVDFILAQSAERRRAMRARLGVGA